MDWRAMKSIIEGLLFAAGEEGLNVKQLAEVLDISPGTADELVQEMQDEWVRQGRGVQIARVAGGYQMTTNPAHAPYFERLAKSPTRAALSQAALETLAIIAYKQPITRIEIEEIRGVKSDRALTTLLNRDLIEEVGRAEAIGRPILYGTTRRFLEGFGLNGLDELPSPESLEQGIDLEEETRLLFDKLRAEQLTLDDLDAADGAADGADNAEEDAGMGDAVAAGAGVDGAGVHVAGADGVGTDDRAEAEGEAGNPDVDR